MSQHDCARLQDLEEQVAELKEQLVRAQRMEVVGSLVGTTTHEFNNILTTVINHAKLGLRNAESASNAKAFEKILAAGQRAARITRGILTMARNKSADFEPTNLAEIMDDVMILLEREMTKYRVKVEIKAEPVPEAMANAVQIHQVLMNLMVNARQAMPHGGHIFVRIWRELETNLVCCTVRDTGQGIPSESLPRIFEPYYSTKKGPDASGKGGTGLGLATCKNIIEAHHGRIRVESAQGTGTAFTVKLPAAVAAATLDNVNSFAQMSAPAART
jgi:signal transduction histidine kinase